MSKSARGHYTQVDLKRLSLAQQRFLCSHNNFQTWKKSLGVRFLHLDQTKRVVEIWSHPAKIANAKGFLENFVLYTSLMK